MPLTEFQREVLGWVRDDYESPETICGDIARKLGRAVSSAEVSAALAALVGEGLVAAFRYNKAEETFERVDLDAHADAGGLWYLALSRGAAQSDRAAL